MNRYRYEFVNLQTGKPCCKTNDLTHLCASCRARAGSAPAPAAPVVAAATSDVPDAPSLSARVGGPEVMMSPVFGGGPRRQPLVVAGGVPDVPSLTDAVVAARKKGGR
jgi:hypothetical protein